MKTRWTMMVAGLAIAGCATAPGAPEHGGAGYGILQTTGCTPAPTEAPQETPSPTPTTTVDPGVEG